MSHSVRLLASVGAISLLLAACEPPTWPQFGRTPPPPAADADGEELGVPTDQEVYAGIVEDYRKDNSPEAEAQILARAEDLSRSGYTPASILAGNLYSQGYGYSGDIDHRKAFEHYLIAGRAGDSNAYLGLALSAKRLDDHGGYQPSEVLEILEKSVREMPSTAGHINLGRFYAEGFGRPRNVPAAEAEYRKAAALGAPRTETEIGRLYSDPAQPEFDAERALQHFQAAAQQGDENAPFYIADLFSGRIDSVAPRPVLVASALTPLADGGNARAALLVGRLHADPKSPVYDPVRAKAYLDPIGSANAQLLLAEMYAANGPDQDVVEAEIYYRQAMASGEEFARYRLAVMFVRQGASRSKVQQTLQPMLDAGDERAVNLLALVPE